MKQSKKKIYLITSFHKLNYPIGSELIFIDEFEYNLHTEKDRCNYECSYVNSIEDINRVSNSINNIIKKKLKLYREKIKNLLNTYHKKNYSTKYWGLILDQFLLNILLSIIIETKLLKKIKKKKFSNIKENIENKFLHSSIDFETYKLTSSYAKLLKALILKELNFKNISLNYKNNNKIESKIKETTYSEIFLKFFIKLYISLFKPVVIIDGYIGLKNSIYLFFKSFCRVVSIPKKFIFDESYVNCPIDRKFRQNIKVNEKDLIDKVFNKLIGNFFPINFLENYISIENQVKDMSQKIKKLGTGVLHICNDHFTILASKILKRKGKLLTFQHGGLFAKTNLVTREHIDQHYASKTYYFDNKFGLGQHFFNTKKISFDEFKKRNSILILNTDTTYERCSVSYHDFNHPYLEQSQVFFSNLKESNKKKVLLKLFAQENSLQDKKIWLQKFGSRINFLPYFSSAKKERYYDAKLVVLNEFSTALYELLFLRLPFILICKPHNYISFNKKFRSKVINLKKINLLFEDPIKAANFVNTLIKNNQIEEWWKKIYKTKIVLDLKNFLIIEKKNYPSMIAKDLTKNI